MKQKAWAIRGAGYGLLAALMLAAGETASAIGRNAGVLCLAVVGVARWRRRRKRPQSGLRKMEHHA